MARSFNGSTDHVRTSIGGMSGATLGDTTWVAVIRLVSDGALISISTNTDSFISALSVESDGTFWIGADSAGLSFSTTTVTSGDGWVILAATKASGTATPRYHKYTFSTGVWVHENGDGTVDNGPTAASTARIRLGSYEAGTGGFEGDMAAAGLWRRVLTDAEIERLAISLLTWVDSAPTAMWVLDQAATGSAVNDWTGGGAQQAAISGTAVATGASPPLAYTPGVILEGVLSIPAEADPDAIVAPWTLPAPGLSLGLNIEPGPIAAPWAVPTPEVSITGSPPTQVQPSPIVAPWSLPAPAVRVDVTVTPAPILAAWQLPGPTVTVPINPGDDLDGPGQLSLNGFRLGSGTVYGLEELIGADIDLPGVDNGNVLNPSSDGAMPGRKLSQPRIITASFKVRAPRDEMRATMEAFRDNTPLADSDEEVDLAIQVLDTIYLARGAVTRRSAPINKHYRLGLAKAVLQFECSDPRLYSRDLGSANISDGQTVAVTNLGNRRTRPLVRIPGPADTPRLEVFRVLADGTEDLRVLEFDLAVADGDTLTVDIARGTAELDDESSQTRYLTGASVGLPSWVLGRGTSEVTYDTEPGTAPPLTMLWRHAWL